MAGADLEDRWLTLGEASERLEVHPATLRQWADRGRIPTYRTPGGHRRFALSDLDSLKSPATPAGLADTELLLTAALGRARLEMSGGRRVESGWYGDLDTGQRDRHQALGRELLALIARRLGDPDLAPTEQVRAAGRRYGAISREAGVPLSSGIRMFLLFRDLLIESIVQISAARTPSPAAWAAEVSRAHREAGAILDEVLIAFLDAYEGPA